MKNSTKGLILLVGIALLMQPLGAEEGKTINVFGNLGFNAGDFEGLSFDLGAEMQFTEKIWGQILFDYYCSPLDESIVDINDSAWGINAYGVYTFAGGANMNFYVKGGVNYTTVKASTDFIFDISASTSDFGIGIGGGMEYTLQEKLSLVAGVTLKTAFSDNPSTWIKFYGGLKFAIK
jgi:opacity protein-like surface antigen